MDPWIGVRSDMENRSYYRIYSKKSIQNRYKKQSKKPMQELEQILSSISMENEHREPQNEDRTESKRTSMIVKNGNLYGDQDMDEKIGLCLNQGRIFGDGDEIDGDGGGAEGKGGMGGVVQFCDIQRVGDYGLVDESDMSQQCDDGVLEHSNFFKQASTESQIKQKGKKQAKKILPVQKTQKKKPKTPSKAPQKDQKPTYLSQTATSESNQYNKTVPLSPIPSTNVTECQKLLMEEIRKNRILEGKVMGLERENRELRGIICELGGWEKGRTGNRYHTESANEYNPSPMPKKLRSTSKSQTYTWKPLKTQPNSSSPNLNLNLKQITKKITQLETLVSHALTSTKMPKKSKIKANRIN